MLFKRKSGRAPEPEPESVGVGPAGERLAVNYLSSKGLKKVETNFRTKFGEIDLVCLDGDVVVFVEVKTRRSRQFGSPVEAVSLEKQRRLSMAASIFLSRRAWEGRRARFDVLGIGLFGEQVEIEHIPDAFDRVWPSSD
ncbi:MAG: YraN family protein [Pseudomonadota bacterium]